MVSINCHAQGKSEELEALTKGKQPKLQLVLLAKNLIC